MKKRHQQKLIVISLILFVSLNAPIIFIFNIPKAIFGIPLLYFAIFGIWAFSILFSYIVLKKYYE